MHIAYLHYLAAGDTALHHVRQFADAARGLGHRVEVYPLNPAAFVSGAIHSGSVLPRVRKQSKKYFRRHLHEVRELVRNWYYLREELSLLRDRRPDILIARDHALTASFALTARRLQLPLLIEVNSPALESRQYLTQYMHLPWIPELIEGWKLRRANRIVVVSGALGDYLEQRYRLGAGKIDTVLNGADTHLFHPDVEPDRGLPEDFSSAPVIGYVGSFQSWHGIGLLSRMIQNVVTSTASARFLIVGDASQSHEMSSLRSSFDDRLVLTGPVEHSRVPGLVAAFTIGVVADAAFYQCPLKVLEWMAAGKAVVAPRYEPLEELIKDGVDGLLFKPGDAQDFSSTVIRLLRDPDLCRQLGDAAFRKARSSLSWEHNASQILSICEEISERI